MPISLMRTFNNPSELHTYTCNKLYLLLRYKMNANGHSYKEVAEQTQVDSHKVTQLLEECEADLTMREMMSLSLYANALPRIIFKSARPA